MLGSAQRVAVVTGSSQGIGLAIAQSFVNNGWRVAFVSLGLEQIRSSFLTEVELHQVLLYEMDVTETDKIGPCLDDIIGQWGQVDVLVNNAGIRTVTSNSDMKIEEWNRVLSVNLGSTFFFSQAVAPIMKKRGWGRIINMSSFAGQFGPVNSSAAYAASKAGQLALTKVFARELAPYGITVNAISPASVRTPEMDTIAPADMEKMVATIPLGRVGEAEEVAAMVMYLAADSTGFVTGATLDINGGRLMR
ncbi:SDR family NAD(P)-dependent oxidoreductase [Paenibacillus periandrae]|uniref:SDR family NAD(P)-dependent oxidoreductase n=1 Tax=Paenibacillus periandrae TaxID=1761741 RepID=UPI001F090A49|nr:3-oxoacyl-ACP reductase FabG [Paenibacillus periandrae]